MKIETEILKLLDELLPQQRLGKSSNPLKNGQVAVLQWILNVQTVEEKLIDQHRTGSRRPTGFLNSDDFGFKRT